MLDRNPYHPLAPPDDPTLFFGREDVIAFLRQNLVGANNHDALLLLGRVGMGKTSLLQHTLFVVDERYQPVYVELTSQQLPTFATFIVYLYETILNRMETIGASTYRVPALPPSDSSPDELQRWFADDFLEVVLTAIHRNRYLLLLLDDFQFIFEAMDTGNLPADFITYLSRLLAQHDRLDMVIALDMQHEQRALQYGLLSNINRQFRLAHLTPDATHQLITEPVPYQYTDDVLQNIMKLSGGYPFIVHSICRLLYRYQEGTPQLRLINDHALESVYPAALEEVDTVMRPYWDGATSNQQQVLLALVALQKQMHAVPVDILQKRLERSGFQLNHTQLASTLRGLEYASLVQTTTDGRYHTSTGLEADWIEFHMKPASIDMSSLLHPTGWRTRLIGAGVILIAIVLLGSILMLGLLDNGDEPIEPNTTNAPPTLTLEHHQSTGTPSLATRTALPSTDTND